jgi:hypothetical protein
MSSLASAGETIETKEFGTVKVGSTVTYTNRPGENRFAWGTVRDVGPGAAWMKDRYRLDRILRAGDVIGFDQSQYVDWHDNDERLMILPVDAALCRLNPGDAAPTPLGVYFMSVPDDDATRRFTLGKKAMAAGFILTNDRAKGEITVTDNPNSKVRYSAERVVAVGGGGMSIGDAGQQALGDTRAYCTTTADGKIVRVRVKSPIEVIPDPYAVGKLAVFGNTMSVDAWVNGTRFKFTNWDRVRALAET